MRDRLTSNISLGDAKDRRKSSVNKAFDQFSQFFEGQDENELGQEESYNFACDKVTLPVPEQMMAQSKEEDQFFTN